MAGHTPEEIKAHARNYLYVGGLLFVFTIITVLVSFWESENHAVNVAIGLLIASFKAALVAWVFMHLSTDRRHPVIKALLVAAAIFFIALMFLTLWGKWNPIQTILS
jgi:caa(3)-type oxidase subunit IV